MAQKHKHRVPKLKNVQRMYQECTSSTTSGAISLHTEDHVVEEQQSYAMVTGLLQVLVHMYNSPTKRLPANLLMRHQGGQYCLSTVSHMLYRLPQPVS